MLYLYPTEVLSAYVCKLEEIPPLQPSMSRYWNKKVERKETVLEVKKKPVCGNWKERAEWLSQLNPSMPISKKYINHNVYIQYKPNEIFIHSTSFPDIGVGNSYTAIT